ncbi:hypothetical protein P3X46_025818 [Hevea brasiliensis]|uniref:Ribosome biogenesis protein NOP53 n=1 Tax=Hevea brasiliensis TaxID=3981 RepID=A0ABQ9L6R2_HEVBR|nr:hypothetical protein P3X46_025818 [Hevea brasiliensis]
MQGFRFANHQQRSEQRERVRDGEAKSSRKGKKAWRAKISTKDIDDFIEKSTKGALSDVSARRNIEKHREKVLRCDNVLQKNPFVLVVLSSNQKKKKKTKKTRKDSKPKGATQDGSKSDRPVQDSGMVDLWESERWQGVYLSIDNVPGGCDNKIRKIFNQGLLWSSGYPIIYRYPNHQLFQLWKLSLQVAHLILHLKLNFLTFQILSGIAFLSEI